MPPAPLRRARAARGVRPARLLGAPGARRRESRPRPRPGPQAVHPRREREPRRGAQPARELSSDDGLAEDDGGNGAWASPSRGAKWRAEQKVPTASSDFTIPMLGTGCCDPQRLLSPRLPFRQRMLIQIGTFLRREMPVRLAKRVVELRNLPEGV